MFSVLRYFRLILTLIQAVGYQSLRTELPTVLSQHQPEDVTIISCTLGTETTYGETIRRWVESRPKEIIIVTIASRKTDINRVIQLAGFDNVRVFYVENSDYRKQMTIGIRNARTSVLVLADDRVFWGPRTLIGVLSGFEDPVVGGVNTMQSVIPTQGSHRGLTVWESFGALNLVRRNILHSSLAYYNHGQVLNLSGRTAAYRASILQREDFYEAFLDDRWRDRYLMRTGDDNFLTTWALHQGWKTAFINDPEAAITCYVCPDRIYMLQLLRWSRDTARYYLRDLTWALRRRDMEHIVRCLLNVISNYFSDFELLVEVGSLSVVSIASMLHGIAGNSEYSKHTSKLWTDHLQFIAFCQLIEHYPFFDTWNKARYCIGAVLYTYVHALVVLYAFLTLDWSVWSSRA